MRKAYTLIELIFILAIVAILAGFSVIQIRQVEVKTLDLDLKNTLRKVIEFEQECSDFLLENGTDKKVRYCSNTLGDDTSDNHSSEDGKLYYLLEYFDGTSDKTKEFVIPIDRDSFTVNFESKRCDNPDLPQGYSNSFYAEVIDENTKRKAYIDFCTDEKITLAGGES